MVSPQEKDFRSGDFYVYIGHNYGHSPSQSRSLKLSLKYIVREPDPNVGCPGEIEIYVRA